MNEKEEEKELVRDSLEGAIVLIQTNTSGLSSNAIKCRMKRVADDLIASADKVRK